MSVLSPSEREVVVLAVAIEAINDMVNHEMMSLPRNGGPDAETPFRSPASAALFTVLLADALENVDPTLLGIDGSLLDAIWAVCEAPVLATEAEAAALRRSITDLRAWLDCAIEVDVWFPSIDKNVRLTLQRRAFIAICGNISKHNLTRLTRKARQLQTLLKANGVDVTDADALGALDDFYEKFQTDVIAFHSTTLAEMLNNVRWGIHEYLTPEFARSYVPPRSAEERAYDFNVPREISNTFAISRYWDIMNSVRSQPWIPKFTGTRHLKGRF